MHPCCITEKKFKTILGKIWLGLKDMGWLGHNIEKAASNDTVGQDFFRHHRDGYKAIHVIRRSNQHGQYLEVSEFHSGARKGVIRIPAGLEKQGWKQFAGFCKGHQNTQILPTNDRRGVGEGVAVSEKKVEESLPKIMHKNLMSQTHVTAAVKSAVGSLSAETQKPIVNTHVLLNLKLELICGLDGEWAVSNVELIKTEPKPFSSLKPVTKAVGLIGPDSRPVSRQEWRPKIAQASHKAESGPAASAKTSSSTAAPPPSLEHIPDIVAATPTPEESDDVAGKWFRPKTQVAQASHKADPGPEASAETSSSTDAPPSSLEHIPDPGAASHTPEESEDEAGKWLMQFTPQPPPLPLSPNPFYLLSSEHFTETSEIPELRIVDDPAHISSLIVSDQLIGGDEVVEDEQVKWIEPLAVAYPAVEWKGETEVQEVSVQSKAPEVISGPQSDWVMEKMEEFGVVLGASYLGFEDRVLALLRTIEAETGGSKPGGVPGQKKSRVSRELRKLISNVNYDGGSSRRTTSASGRALMLSK